MTAHANEPEANKTAEWWPRDSRLVVQAVGGSGKQAGNRDLISLEAAAWPTCPLLRFDLTIMWTCIACGEKSEESWDACWNCGASREGVPDPTFQCADDPHFAKSAWANPDSAPSPDLPPPRLAQSAARQCKSLDFRRGRPPVSFWPAALPLEQQRVLPGLRHAIQEDRKALARRVAA